MLRDFPCPSLAHQYNGAAANAQVRSIEHFVEPGGGAVGGKGHVAIARLEAPRGLALKLGLGPFAKFGDGPTLCGRRFL